MNAPLGTLAGIWMKRGKMTDILERSVKCMNTDPNHIRWRRKFITQVQYYLEKNGMTQMELADRIHVNRSTITKYLTGSLDPSVKTVINISMVFGCNVEDLIDFRWDN